jgi:tetratricopeptide (TPR) repeat protein
MARLREDPRFLNPKLSELLVEACHTALPFEPRRAFFLSSLAVELCRLLSENVVEPEVQVMCRALCLGSHACRLLGQHEAAEGLLEMGAYMAQDLAARGFFCRAVALLRWDQGRTEEAAALLSQSGKRYEELGDTGEEAACLALLGLLHTEQEEIDLAEPLLLKARRGLVSQRRPWLTAQSCLSLALCFALTDRLVEARHLREGAWNLFSAVQNKEALFSLLWREAQVAEALGDLAESGQLFESVRRHFIAEGRLPEAALVTVQLGMSLVRQGRAEETRVYAADLAAAFGGRPGLEFSLNTLQCLSEEDSAERVLRVEIWSCLSPTFLLAFQRRGEFSRPVPFV